jgi:two-component system, LytTR family, response regulator
MIKSIIVEDDPMHAKRLIKLLKNLNQPIEIVDNCIDIETAFEAIKKLKPDLVFLDIELNGNGKAGFDLLDMVGDAGFDTIFTTAHIDNNILKMRKSGLFFIIKPYKEDEMEDCMEKYFKKRNWQIPEKTIWLLEDNEHCLYNASQIYYCKSDNQYTNFYIVNGNNKPKVVMQTKGLIYFEKYFEKHNFYRIHNEILVNLQHVKKYIKADGTVVLTNDESLPVARAKRQQFQEFLEIVA